MNSFENIAIKNRIKISEHKPYSILRILAISFLIFACSLFEVPSDNDLPPKIVPTTELGEITETLSATKTKTPTLIFKPKKTSTATFTITPITIGKSRIIDPPIVIFSEKNANPVSPDDVLQEVGYHVTGGGGYCECDQIYKEPTMICSTEKIEVVDFISNTVCGWEKDENVSVTITYPSGKKEEFEEIVYPFDVIVDNKWETTYVTSVGKFVEINDEIGEYKVEISGQSGTFIQIVNVILPNGPRIYWQDAQKTILLYNFTPKENIRIFKYEENAGIAKLAFWISTQVDNYGQLIVKLDFPGELYINEKLIVIIGEISGELKFHVKFRPSAFEKNILISPNLECPGAPPQRVLVGDMAVVCTKKDSVIVRTEPRRGRPEVIRLEPGSIFTIIDGPTCANDWSWWKIQLIDGTVGWVSEGGDNVDPYFICPMK